MRTAPPRGPRRRSGRAMRTARPRGPRRRSGPRRVPRRGRSRALRRRDRRAMRRPLGQGAPTRPQQAASRRLSDLAFDATKGYPGEGPSMMGIDRSEASDVGEEESDDDEERDHEAMEEERGDEEMVADEAVAVPARACTFERVKNHKKDGGECIECARPFVRNTLFRRCTGCSTTRCTACHVENVKNGVAKMCDASVVEEDGAME
eukprot:12030841-Heterocapsa_arctica.AAC.1